MTVLEPVAGDEGSPLWEWRETMQPRLARLEAFEVLGLPLDYSRESLDLLEAEVLDRPVIDDRPGHRDSFTDAAMGYLGEALLTTAGGRWEWDDDDNMPVAHFDDALRLAPIAPLRLIVEASRRRTGREFARVRAALERAVADRQIAEPSWSPTKEPTPGLDRVERFEQSEADYLQRWLAEREKAFPQWLADYAEGTDGWDFSEESLDLLQAAVLSQLKTPEDVERPEHHDFVEGAVWYLGEVHRHEAGAHWVYSDAAHKDVNPYSGRPFVERLTPKENSVLLYAALHATVLRATPGYLRGRLAFFRD